MGSANLAEKAQKTAVSKMLGLSNLALSRVVRQSVQRSTPRALCPVFGYCRKSTKQQREATLEKQAEYIRQYCERNGLQPPVLFYEDGFSGRYENRPVLQDMIGRLTHDTIVICHESTRLAREVLVFLKVYRDIQKAGCTVEFVNVGQTDSIYLTIMAAIADYDFQKTVIQLRDGRVASLRAGANTRSRLYGYTKLEDGRMEINESEARWVRDVFAMRSRGSTYEAAAQYLKDNSVPGGKWSAARIDTMLANSMYAGFIITKKARFAWERQSGFSGGGRDASREASHAILGDLDDETSEGDEQEHRSSSTAAVEELDDYVIVEAPYLRIVEPATFRVANERRLPPGVRRAADTVNIKHPLLHKIRCAHCDSGWMKIKWDKLRCSNAIDHGPCDAPTLDLSSAERAMFDCLYQLAEGREGSYAIKATRRYHEVMAAETLQRQELTVRIRELQTEIRNLAISAAKSPVLVMAMNELADEKGLELERKRAALAEFDAMPEEPDPRTALISLKNMLDHVNKEPSIPYDANEETLTLRDALGALIVSVGLKAKPDGKYDLYFSLDGAKAMGRKGKHIEQIIIKDRVMAWSETSRVRARAVASDAWVARRHHLTDEEWATRPAMPDTERAQGDSLRLVIDIIVYVGECDLRFGKNALVDVMGSTLMKKISAFRGSRERDILRSWLQSIRPRSHGWACVLPEPKRNVAHTPRHRLVAVEHPFAELRGCVPGAPDTVITDEQWAALKPTIEITGGAMRRRIGELFAIVRDDGPFWWLGDVNMAAWFHTILISGDFDRITAFFLEQEGRSRSGPFPHLKRASIKGFVRAKADVQGAGRRKWIKSVDRD